jgi:hypothetical protein
MKTKPRFQVGNQVRVSPGGTLYEVTKIFRSGNCLIREYGVAPNGKHYAEQAFDISLLKHAVTDEMLKAFSFGPLKAVRRTT